jgi:hypothetical protein
MQKIKCSGGQPCLQCQSYGRKCTYDLPMKKRGPGSTRNQLASNRIEYSDINLDWSLERFWGQEIKDRTGESRSWITIYYQHIYDTFPMILELFLRDSFFKIPKELLHSLIACCSVFSNEPEDIFRMHLNASIRLIDQSLDTPDVFTVLAIVHVAIYYILKSELMNALKYLGMLVRLTSVMGLHMSVNHNITYRDSPDCIDGLISQRICLYICVFVYTYDFYISVMNGVPYMVGHEFHHKSIVTGFEGKLIELIQFARLMQKSKSYLEQKRIKMKDEWVKIGSDLDHTSQSATDIELARTSYLKLLHNYLYILLVRDSLLDLSSNSPENIDLLKNSCILIMHIVELEPTLEMIPIFFGQLVFSVGMFCCLRQKDLKDMTCCFHFIKVLGNSNLISFQEKALQLEQCFLDPGQALVHIQSSIIPNF